MPQDESTFDIDFGLGEEKEEEVTIEEERFISDVLGRKGHLINSHNLHGALRILHFMCIADKDYLKGSKFLLCKLPQSQIRLIGYLSSVRSNIKDYVVGWSDFVNRFREKKEGLVDGIMSKKNSGVLDRTEMGSTVFDSLEGVEVYATAKSNGKKGDFVEGIFIYIKK